MPLTVRGNVLNTLTRLQLLVQDGTAASPSIAFSNRPQTGFYRAGAGALGIAVDGVEALRISANGVSGAFIGNGSSLTGLNPLRISNVQVTDASWTPLDDTAMSNSGGYCVVNGTGFADPLGMLIGASYAPTSTTIVSPTQARATIPALPNGTYPLWLFTDQYSVIKNAALSVSPMPVWSTAATLANVTKSTAFTQSLVATEPLNSNITYTLANGSSLPANVTLSANGVLSGNITTDPGNTTTYSFIVQATDTQFQNIPRTFGLTSIRTLLAGENLAYSDVYSAVQSIGVVTSTDLPVVGGSLTLNSQALGSYDYVCKKSSVTVASFTASDWFTSTADTRSAWIKVCGDLTIDSGVTFTPPVRKLFTVIHVTGNLTVNGTISMTARGASHSGTTATAIAIAQGTYSGVVDPNVPATGGSGATAVSSGSGNVNGNAGEMRSDGATGGGGGGGIRNNLGFVLVTGGAGATGTSFSGGPGGGGAWGPPDSSTSITAGSGAGAGGSGGAGATSAANPSGQGGAGNPGGAGVGANAVSGTSGTGGILIIIVEGSLVGSGTVVANGSKGGEYTGASLLGTSGGGGSGGGSVTVFAKTDGSTITVSAAGGAGGLGTGNCSSGVCPGGSAGAGGNGTARKLLL